MKFNYQVITTPTADTPGSTVILHFPNQRYIFGHASEGTQRAVTERGLRITYLTDVFLTGRTEWANNGGLIGIILTLADARASSQTAAEAAAREKQGLRMNKHGMPVGIQDGQVVPQRGSLTVHGGRNLAHTLATARRFVFRKGMPISVKEYDSDNLSKQGVEAEDPFEMPTFTDTNIKVWAMSISPSSQELSGSQTRSPRKRSLDEFQENELQESTAGEPLDQYAKDQVMRHSVVNDMFNSEWRMDALIETPLAQVKMPAAMFIRNPDTKQLEQYTGPAPGSDKPLPDIKVLVRQPWPGASVEKLPHPPRCNNAMSYIVRNHDIRGKFDAKKAKEHKVREGPNFARLTKGESVLSEDGKTVTPEMVLGPPRLGKGMAIIDLPTPEYVENLINRPEWKSPAVTTELSAFVWILGPGVGEHPKLREFVASMPHCKHTVSSTDYCPNYLALNSAASSAIRLARLRGTGYSVPVHDNVTLPQPGTPTENSIATQEAIKTSPFEPVEPGLIVEMEPKFEMNRTEVVPRLNAHETVHNIPFAVEKRMATTRKRIAKPEFKEKLKALRSDLPGSDAEIIALGTGSSSPSKYRNVSATLVRVPGYGYYLLDCGENTLGQLKRVYEPEELRKVLQNLRMIWISHLHADHHLGTATLIKAWYEENYGTSSSSSDYIESDMSKILQEKRLFVVSEANMINWLEEYAAVENFGFGKIIPLSALPEADFRTRFIYRHFRGDGTYPGHEKDSCSPYSTTLRFDDDSSPLKPLLHSATGLSDILTTRVMHCRGAMAVSLVFPNGFKLSYSGDCRPSGSFAAIGQNSTVLIHEATFLDDMAVSAIAKRHSTTAEALEVGRLMKARTILLTHFSQRYAKTAYVHERKDLTKRNPEVVKVPETNQEPDIPADDVDDTPQSTNDIIQVPSTNRQPIKAPVAAAFDYMRIRVGDFPVAQAYAPALEKLFDTLERASAIEAEKNKQANIAREKENTKAKQKKKEEQYKLGQAKKDKDEMDVDKKPSIWSASESESGWDTSGDDSDFERAVKRRDEARKSRK